MKARWIAFTVALLAAAQNVSLPDPDTDRDGLSDFAEAHKYGSDPYQAATADAIPDGGWEQRKEFTYTITSVLQIAKPYNIADMDDDYQDARLLSEDKDSATVEVVYYPLNTNRFGIGENPNWRRDYAVMRQYLQPTITENWDEKMRADLIVALKDDGIAPDQLTDRQLVIEVSRWVMKRSRFNSAFSLWYVQFTNGVPEVFPRLRAAFDREKPTPETTDAAMFDRELLGRGMFYNRVHGSCTSTAVLMATVMRALGIPTRIVFCIPPLDANDVKQQDMMLSTLRHNRVRATIRHGLPDGHGGFSDHIFNEVFVGNRWVRLNYDVLGQNILDAGYFGLLTHVLTTDSVSHVPMHETWGRRLALYTGVEPKLSSVNPYRLLKVSDHFGKFSQVSNPEAPDEELRKVTVTQAFWKDQPLKGLEGILPKAANTDFFVRISEYVPGFRLQLREFYRRAGKQFILEAAGHPEIRASLTGHTITTGNDQLRYQLFGVRVNPEDRSRMLQGVPYRVRPVNDSETHIWSVGEGVTLQGRSL